MVYIVSSRRYSSQRELYRAPSTLELGTMSRLSSNCDTFNRILGRPIPQPISGLRRQLSKIHNASNELPRTHQSRSNWALNEIVDDSLSYNKKNHRHKSPTYERYSQSKSTFNLSWGINNNDHINSNISMNSSSSSTMDSASSKCSSGSAFQSHRSMFDLRSFNQINKSQIISRHGSERNIRRAKQRASILWLLAKAEPDGRVREELQDPFYRDHTGNDCLKPWITQRLATGELYACALSNIYGDPNISNNGHKETLRLLAHKGIQIEDFNTEHEPICETLLMQTNPVRVNAHFVIIECILELFVREILIPVKVWEVVARFSGTIDSIERDTNYLPEMSELSDPESVALFWINRACDQFNCEIAREYSSISGDNNIDPTSSSSSPPFLPSLEELSDMCDGCSIFGLIAFYCANVVSWRSIVLKENISIADSIHNLQKVQQFCLQYLPTHICFLTLEDFLYLPEPLIRNFLAFIADLLYVFEIQPADCVQAPCLRIDYDSDYDRACSEMPTPSEVKSSRSLRHHSWQIEDENSLLHQHHYRRDNGSPIYSSPSQVYETIGSDSRNRQANNNNNLSSNRRDSFHNQNHGNFIMNDSNNINNNSNNNNNNNNNNSINNNSNNNSNGRIDTYFQTLNISNNKKIHQRNMPNNNDNSQLNDYYTNLSSQFDIDGLNNHQQIIHSSPSSGHQHQRLKESFSQNTSASETSSLAELSEYSANDSVRAQLNENRRLIEKRTKQKKEEVQLAGQDFRQEVLKRLDNNGKKISSNPDLDTRKSIKKNVVNSTDDANLTFEIHQLNPMRREGTYSMLAQKDEIQQQQQQQQQQHQQFDKTKTRPKNKDNLEKNEKSLDKYLSSGTFVKPKEKIKHQSSDSDELSEKQKTGSPKQRQHWGAPVMPPTAMPPPPPPAMAQYPYPTYPGSEWGVYPNMYPPPPPHPAQPYGYPSPYTMPPHPLHRFPYGVPAMDPRFQTPNSIYQNPEYIQSMGYLLHNKNQAQTTQLQSQQSTSSSSSVQQNNPNENEIILSNHHFIPVKKSDTPEPIPIESSQNNDEIDEEIHETTSNILQNKPKNDNNSSSRALSPPVKGSHAETFFISFDSDKEKSNKKMPNTRTTTRPKSSVIGDKSSLSRTSTHVINHGENSGNTGYSEVKPPKVIHKEDPKIVAELYNVKPPAPKAQAIAFLIEADDVSPPIVLNGNDSNSGARNSVSHDPTEIEIKRKKEAMMKQSMKRRAEAEKKRLEKEAELSAKKADELRKKEEQERKKEEAAAKRAAILEEYKKRKKEDEEAERDARSGMPRSSSTLNLNRTSGGVTMRSTRQGSAGRPRPKSLHNSAIDPNGNNSGERLSASRDEIDLMRFNTASRPQSAANTPTFDNSYSSSNFYVSTEYNGPKLFVKPSQKSNKTLMLNAINVVLAGAVNSDLNRRVLNVISSCDSKYYLILFRNAQLQYRAIYAYYPEREEGVVIKLDGNGPKRVTNDMIEKFFKYNSGTKNFNPIQTKHLSVTIDAFIIFNHLWQKTGPTATGTVRPIAAAQASRKFI